MDLILQKSPFALLAERDMDLLVLEEMHTSPAFKGWLVTKLYNNTRQIRRFIGARHAPSHHTLGAVDILFLFEDATARKCAILIENKIDQPKQDLQAQRYFEFGEQGVKDGTWDEYLTCLFSPQAYFSKLEPSEYFSSYLSYEELADWFSHASREYAPERGAYKAMLVREAIQQGAEVAQHPVPQSPKKSTASDFRVFPGGVFNLPKGYREAEDTLLGKLWTDYDSYTHQYFPELGMKKPTGSASEAGWVEFSPQSFPKDIKIIHKMPQGFMDLSFGLASLAMIETPYRPFIDSDMTFKENGKAAVIRINLPPIDPHAGFSSQQDLVKFALQKAQKLYQLYNHVVVKEPTQGYSPEELFL